MKWLRGLVRSVWDWVRRYVVAIVATLLAILLLTLIGTVVALGGFGDRLGLASELAAGLVVALVVVLWEQREQARSRREAANARNAVQRTITEYVGAKLSPLGAELQLIGVDDDGDEIELFTSIDKAVNAYRSHTDVERMMREVGKRRGRSDLQVALLETSRDAVFGFYDRLERHFDVFLDYFIASGDDRTVGALLELWDHQSNIPQPPSLEAPSVTEVQNMLQGTATPTIVQQHEYLTAVMRLLLWYSELLRAIDDVSSGIPGRRERTR